MTDTDHFDAAEKLDEVTSLIGLLRSDLEQSNLQSSGAFVAPFPTPPPPGKPTFTELLLTTSVSPN